MNKRIAVLFYGHLRTFRTAFPYFKKNVIEEHKKAGYEVDIFIHTWDIIEYAITENPSWDKDRKTSEGFNGVKLTEDDIQFVRENYQPVVLRIEEQNLANKDRRVSRKNVRDIFMNYRLGNNIKYDWVILTRPDIIFLKPLLIDDYMDAYEGKFDSWNSCYGKLKFNPILNSFNVIHDSIYRFWPKEKKKVLDTRIIWTDTDLINIYKPEFCPDDSRNNVIHIDYIGKNLEFAGDWSILRFNDVDKVEPLEAGGGGGGRAAKKRPKI
jgi:hypothetical protein